MSNVVNERWENGVPHHPVANALESLIRDAQRHCRYDLDIEFGGDGDNGEDLLFCLSQLFEDKPEALDLLRDALEGV